MAPNRCPSLSAR